MEGFYRGRAGMDQAVSRALAYAPHVDAIWCETGHPDLDEARTFALRVHVKFHGKLLAYNCSPSCNWKRHLDDATIARFQREVGAGYFDALTQVITGGTSSLTSLQGSTEEEQLHDVEPPRAAAV